LKSTHKLTDEQKEEDRRTRIQHPHIIKSKAHWDWESGYGDMEAPIVISKPTSHTKKISAFTIAIIALINWIIK
jgi:galactose-1-phosphate uridylyltransferase